MNQKIKTKIVTAIKTSWAFLETQQTNKGNFLGLAFTKDDKGNIVKTISYHFKN